MAALFSISISIFMGVMVYQDFKDRSISLIMVILTAILVSWSGYYYLEINQILKFAAINVAIISIHLFVVSIYYFLKNRKLTMIVNNQIGLGDILVLIVVCFAFSPLNFTTFLMLSLALTLLFHQLGRQIWKGSAETIPLAGYLSLFYIITLLYSQFLINYNLHDDSVIAWWFVNIL